MDFVDFELAKKLKEKGFPQVKKGTLAMYNEEGEWYSLARNLDEFEYLFEDFDYHDCVCPTISQVLKWFRDKKNISVEPCATSYNCWYYMIKCNGKIKVTYMNDKYKTYEAAALTGIEYVLDNLI